MIETHHVSKPYSRGLHAFFDLSLTIGKGEFVFLAGASNAGKSTFLRLLPMQERQSEDEIEIMRLVGIPITFIRGPFVAEKVLQGGWAR